MSRPIKPLRNEVLIRQIEPKRISAGGIVLRQTIEEVSQALVLALGPDCYGLEVGDTVVLSGYRSGIAMGDNLFLVSDEIVLGVVLGDADA